MDQLKLYKCCTQEVWDQFAQDIGGVMESSTMYSCGIVTTEVLGAEVKIDADTNFTRVQVAYNNDNFYCDIDRDSERLLTGRDQIYREQLIRLDKEHRINSNQPKKVKALFDNKIIGDFFTRHYVSKFNITPGRHILGSWYPYGLNRIIIETELINTLEELKHLLNLVKEIQLEIKRFNDFRGN